MATYIIKRDNASQYYWVLRSDKNSKIICMSSETYIAKQGVKDSIKWTQVNARSAATIDFA